MALIGAVATVTEIAAAERINESYVSRVLRLTLLAPEIVEAILDGRQPAAMTLPVLMGPFPVAWDDQGGGLDWPRVGQPAGGWNTGRLSFRMP